MRKFERVIPITDWEVFTPEGWVNCTNVMKTVPYEKWVVEFDCGAKLECADTHIVMSEYNSEVFVKDLIIGDVIKTINGTSKVISITNTTEYENMYDVEVDSESHQYYSNGIVSHNTTTAAAYLLYEAIFNSNKSIGILANKGATSAEILDRLCKMFEELPWFLKPGVVTWNKTSITLANGSKCFSAATSSSSIRGKSVGTLYCDEFAHIDNDVEFFESTYPVISSGKTTKVIITSTPKGMNLFYKLWIESEQGRNEFVRSKYLWYDHPERDEAWRQTTESNIGTQNFSQEYDCCSANTEVIIKSENSICNNITFGDLYQLINNSQTPEYCTRDFEISNNLIYDAAISLAFNSNLTIPIVVGKSIIGCEILNKIIELYNGITSDCMVLKSPLKHRLKKSVESQNGVKIYVERLNKQSFIGRTIHSIIIDSHVIDKVSVYPTNNRLNCNVI